MFHEATELDSPQLGLLETLLGHHGHPYDKTYAPLPAPAACVPEALLLVNHLRLAIDLRHPLAEALEHLARSIAGGDF